jgi:hypothetical protein
LDKDLRRDALAVQEAEILLHTALPEALSTWCRMFSNPGGRGRKPEFFAKAFHAKILEPRSHGENLKQSIVTS